MLVKGVPEILIRGSWEISIVLWSKPFDIQCGSLGLSGLITWLLSFLRGLGLWWGLGLWLATWASYQIRKIAGCACAGNAGNVFPRRRFQMKPLVSDPGMHHGTCVTHVPWCMSGSLTCGDGENVPGIPGACALAISRIWQEVHISVYDFLIQWCYIVIFTLVTTCRIIVGIISVCRYV